MVLRRLLRQKHVMGEAFPWRKYPHNHSVFCVHRNELHCSMNVSFFLRIFNVSLILSLILSVNLRRWILSSVSTPLFFFPRDFFHAACCGGNYRKCSYNDVFSTMFVHLIQWQFVSCMIWLIVNNYNITLLFFYKNHDFWPAWFVLT